MIFLWYCSAITLLVYYCNWSKRIFVLASVGGHKLYLTVVRFIQDALSEAKSLISWYIFVGYLLPLGKTEYFIFPETHSLCALYFCKISCIYVSKKFTVYWYLFFFLHKSIEMSIFMDLNQRKERIAHICYLFLLSVGHLKSETVCRVLKTFLLI